MTKVQVDNQELKFIFKTHLLFLHKLLVLF